MTKELMRKYPEYSRRKLGPFRQLVHQGMFKVNNLNYSGSSKCFDKYIIVLYFSK